MKIKIGVLSDTHLPRVTKEFREIYDKHLSDKDIILHAGDVVSTEIVDFLSRKNFHGVHGNMDPPEVKDLLPRKKVIELGGCRVGLIHGWGSSEGLEDRIWPEFEKVDAIVYGHSHLPASNIRQGVLFLNPGASTGYSPSGVNTMAVLELDETIRSEIIRL